MLVTNNYSDFLPDKRYYEYAYHKSFNPETKYELWSPWDEWDYPEHDIERFRYIIHDNLSAIKGKKVLDVGCHLGYMSLFCLYNQCSSVTGVNIRITELEIAGEICEVAGYKNFNFLNQDIYDIEKMRLLYQTHETAIISGLIYHINNHYQFFESLSVDTALTDLIIESEITTTSEPSITWKSENGNANTNGFYQKNEKILVGVPSQSAIELMLTHFGWEITQIQKFNKSTSNGRNHCRSVTRASRNNAYS